MKTLKIILGLIYPILTILLLLTNFGNCQHNLNSHNTVPAPTPIADSGVTPGPTDTSNIGRAIRTGNTGALKVTLLWPFWGDIDLHVCQPNGKEICFSDKKDTRTGGYLDVDNRNGGPDSAENIYWERPVKGEYLVSIHYYGKSSSQKIADSGTCTVVVFQEGKSTRTYSVDMLHVNDLKNVVKVIVD